MTKFFAISPNNSLIFRAHRSHNELVQGLLSTEQSDGWSDPTFERAHFLWTTLEVCRILLRGDVIIRNLEGVLIKVYSSKVEVDKYVGWETDGGAGIVATFVTRDAGALFLQLGLVDSLKDVFQTLGKLQNTDGGWGVCNGDKLSKTRATSFVLTFLADCLNSSHAQTYVNLDSYVAALKWLYSAQTENGGWANIADIHPDNISATAIALDALLSSMILKQRRPEIQIPIRDQILRFGIDRLITLCSQNGFRGFREEFIIDLPSGNQYKHTAGGLGGSVIGTVLSKAAYLRFISISNTQLINCIQDLISRTKQYHQKQGAWIVPSDENGPPTSWNTAFAVEALIEFERVYTAYLYDGEIEDTFIQRSETSAKKWKRWTIALAIILIIMLLTRYTILLGNTTSWFNSQPSLFQGLIMIFITLAIERLLSIVNVAFKKIKLKIPRHSEKILFSNKEE